MKTILTSLARHMGFELVPAWRMERHELAKHLREVLARIEADTVVDVGANLGQYRDFLRTEVGFEGTIHSFEPVRQLQEALAVRAANDPGWVVHRLALGATESEMALNVMRDSQFSSLLEPQDSALNDYDRQNRVEHRETVRVRRLDDVVDATPSLARARSIYLKLDTQGYDLEVLKGATRMLRSVGALQTEASMLPLYRGMPDYRTSIATLDGLGFDISGMFPIARDQYLRVVEFDCVMVNREKAGARRLAA